jgi:hypothetical protein
MKCSMPRAEAWELTIHLTLEPFVKIVIRRRVALLLMILLYPASLLAQQSARIEIGSPTRVRANVPIELEVTLRNTGASPFYVVGYIGLALMQLDGDFRLMVQEANASNFEAMPGVSDDRLQLIGAEPIPDQFRADVYIASEGLVLLQPDHFIGRSLLSLNWYDLTLRPYGKYQLKVVYDGMIRSEEADLLRYPLLGGVIESNILDIKVLP